MDTQAATREILWNIGTLPNVLTMYGCVALASLIGLAGIWRRVELWSSGVPAPAHKGHWAARVSALFVRAGLQTTVVRETSVAAAHTLVYLGFLTLLLTTTVVMIHHDLGIEIYQGNFYLLLTLGSDILGFGLMVGCLLFAHRRYVAPVDRLHNRPIDSLFLVSLFLLCAQGFLLEGLRIQAVGDPWRHFSPVGLLVARFFWGLSPHGAATLHYFIWWFHALTVFVVIAVVPYTKFFHVLASSANLFFRSHGRLPGSIEPMGDIEKLMESGDENPSFGLTTLKDYSWKKLLDLDACTSCGRCQAVCPAYQSGKPLSPKWMILDTRNHALQLQTEGKLTSSWLPQWLVTLDQVLLGWFLRLSGISPTESAGSYRGENKQVQGSVRTLGGTADARIAGDVMDPAVFWSCTTCMACVEACPVGIDHLSHIIGNRRSLALMHGEIPSEAQATLKALENRANPYGAPEDRIQWLTDLNVRILKPGDEVDYLYWVGCVSAYDPRKQKIARSLVKIMNAAGLSFGILGTAEGCTGDPARRLGEENLFQTMAKKNIETLTKIRFKNLVANCPHCFNSIKNEYPEFGNLGDGKEPRIIHHSQLLRELVSDGKLKLKTSTGDGIPESVTLHDPCYLARYNNDTESPRSILKQNSALRVIEMDRSGKQGMCCGAGGGHFFMDLKNGERINTIRVDQAAATGASTIATACPFCMQMMEDGVKLTNREMIVKDVAEVLAEQLEG